MMANPPSRRQTELAEILLNDSRVWVGLANLREAADTIALELERRIAAKGINLVVRDRIDREDDFVLASPEVPNAA
jgi:hypothetical protein